MYRCFRNRIYPLNPSSLHQLSVILPFRQDNSNVPTSCRIFLTVFYKALEYLKGSRDSEQGAMEMLLVFDVYGPDIKESILNANHFIGEVQPLIFVFSYPPPPPPPPPPLYFILFYFFFFYFKHSILQSVLEMESFPRMFKQ